jgi:hypothetical protein
MALNPLLDQTNTPMLYPSEVVVDVQKKCKSIIEFNDSTGIVNNTGTVYLTNGRIIYISDQSVYLNQNFALHFNLINEEIYNIDSQKLVLKGNLNPYSNLMPCSGKFKIEFDGEANNFKNFLTNFLRQIRMISHSAVSQASSHGNQAYVDPADPDRLLIVDKNSISHL